MKHIEHDALDKKDMCSSEQMNKTVKTEIDYIQREVVINVTIDISKYKLLLAIDTGATVSMLKSGKLLGQTPLNVKDKMHIRGFLPNQQMESLGSTNVRLNISGETFEHKFHIINFNANISVDGVIGMDFLHKYCATISFKIPELTLIKTESFKEKSEKTFDQTQNQNKPVTVPTLTNISNKKVSNKNFYEELSGNFAHQYRKVLVEPYKKQQKKETNENVNQDQGSIANEKNKIKESEKEANDEKKNKNIIMGKEFGDKKFVEIDLNQDVCCKGTEGKNYFIKADIVENLHELSVKKEMMMSMSELQEERVNNEENFLEINEQRSEFANVNFDFENVNFDDNIDEMKLNLTDPDETNLRGWDITDNEEIIDPDERCKYILENVDISHIKNEEYKERLKNLFCTYSKAFQLPDDKFEHTDIYKHRIVLKPEAGIVHTRQFRLPQSSIPDIKLQIEKLLKNGIIRRSTSPYNSPIMLVPKKDEKTGLMTQIRMVVDYRDINLMTVDTIGSYFPLIDGIVDQGSNKKIFITVDLKDAFFQLPLTEDSMQYTSFTGVDGKYEFTGCPFGLRQSPLAFTHAMTILIGDMLGKGSLFFYMDDICIMGENEQDALDILEELLLRIVRHKLKINVKKSSFLKTYAKFLGFVLSQDGLRADPSKVDSIAKLKTPRTVKEIQSVLGSFLYFRCFIPHYSDLTQPLVSLIRKGVKFNWTPKCENAFNELKKILMSKKVLMFPCFDKPFIIHTDASDYAVGSHLSQITDEGKRVIHYFSKTMNSAQKRYSTIEKELLAIVLSLNYFTPYLINHECLIYSDSKALMYLFSSRTKLNARLIRWRFFISGFKIKIVYIPAKQNSMADFLSRIKTEQEETEIVEKNEYKLEIIDEKDVANLFVVTRAQQAKIDKKKTEAATDYTYHEEYRYDEDLEEHVPVIRSDDEFRHKYELYRDYDYKNVLSPQEKEQINESLIQRGCDKEELLPIDSESNEEENVIPQEIDEEVIEEIDEEENEILYEIDEDEIEVIPSFTDQNPIVIEPEVTETVYGHYKLLEQRDMLLKPKQHEPIFYIFCAIDCELHRKLQYKLKLQIVVPSLQVKNDIYKLDDNRSIIVLSNQIKSDEQMNATREVFTKIIEFCNEKVFTNIAINVDYRDARSYFRFRQIICQSFIKTKIIVTLFLNRVAEVDDSDLIKQILYTYHDSPMGMHGGYIRMSENIKQAYKWVNMSNDIKNYIKQCRICETSKITRHVKNPLMITPDAEYPFQKVFFDLIGPIAPLSSKNHQYIFTCVDSLTRYAIAYPMYSCTAEECAKVFLEQEVLVQGYVAEIVTDCATYFVGKLFKELTKLLEIRKYNTTPYSPRSNLSERFNLQLKRYLSAYVITNPRSWHMHLKMACFAYNASYNGATGFSPFYLLRGFEVSFPKPVLSNRACDYTYDNYISDVKYRLKAAHDLAREHLLDKKLENKKYFDRHVSKTPLVLKRNDCVLHRIMVKQAGRKFPNSLYTGPFRVEGMLTPVVAIIRKKGKNYHVNTNQLKKVEADYGHLLPPRLD